MISLIIPFFNEQAGIRLLFDRVNSAAQMWNTEYEVICINDGSNDNTWYELERLNQLDPRWKCISLSRNFGHQVAVSAGIHHASGDAAIILDADLQDPPESIVRLLEKWQLGYEVVYAVRTKRHDPWIKKSLAWIYYRLISKASSIQIPKDSGDYCLLDRRILDMLKHMPERNRYLRGLRSWCGGKQIGIEFARDERAAGKPQYTFRKSLKLATDGVFAFTDLPRRMIRGVGTCLAVFGLALFATNLVWSLVYSEDVASSLVNTKLVCSAILIVGGIQLWGMGILAEYLSRIYEEVRDRPLWLIRDSVGIEVVPNSDTLDYSSHSNAKSITSY